MGTDIRRQTACRLAEYIASADLKRVSIAFHGGEPLLMAADDIVSFADQIQQLAGSSVHMDFGMQTNGLLLTDEVLDKLERAGISVSLSLDGPKETNDLHRTTRRGRSSYARVLQGLELLKRRPKVFAGVIAVIDPTTDPEELLGFFAQHSPPKLDFLLPDAHHLRLPPGRAEHPQVYRAWLLRAFDLWFDRYPQLPVRTFEALLDSAAGLPSGTDAFGLGDVSLIAVETDGSYHDLDVLKIVGDGVTALPGTVSDTAIADIATSPALAFHRQLLTAAGLSPTCRTCTAVSICGGGSVPHRFGANGFENPSVYCEELYALIKHVESRLAEGLNQGEPDLASKLPTGFSLQDFELAETAGPTMAYLLADAAAEQTSALRDALPLVARAPDVDGAAGTLLQEMTEQDIGLVAREPGVIAWLKAYAAARTGQPVLDVEGHPLQAEPGYLAQAAARFAGAATGLRVAEADLWLRAPFGSTIAFETAAVADPARALVQHALEIVRRWRPVLADELGRACRAVQFVHDPTAHPDKIVSFSDNAVPGALFVSVRQEHGLIDPYDLADSLIHEHRHQKLYLLERVAPTVSPLAPLVVSPWRAELRPPSGLLHAVFVFVELRRFWLFVQEQGGSRLRDRAVVQVRETDENLERAIVTLRNCQLTATGQTLLDILDRARRPLAVAA